MYFSTPVAACAAVVFADTAFFAIYLATPVVADDNLTCFSKYLDTPVPDTLFKYLLTPVIAEEVLAGNGAFFLTVDVLCFLKK